MAQLKLEGITKIFGSGVRALDGFSLDIAEGEFITVVGPSGCGKSTLLRIIAGLEAENSGRILMDGRALNGLPPRERDMAIMFQNYALFPHLTVAENMGFGLKLRKTPKTEIATAVKDVSAMLGISDLVDRYPSQMSGGQRQRAALGRAILRKPKLFLFDEPLSNLDAQMRAQLRVEIARLHRSLRSTMIFVTHDQVEAMTLGDRVVVLKDGVIQQAASPDTIYQKPATAFVASFIGTPGMNLLPGKLERAFDILYFIHPRLRFPIDPEAAQTLQQVNGKNILMGIRPEDLGSSEAQAASSEARKAASESSQAVAHLAAQVSVVERLGGQSCLYLQWENTTFAARPHGLEARAGDTVTLPFLPSKAHWFMAETGLRVAT